MFEYVSLLHCFSRFRDVLRSGNVNKMLNNKIEKLITVPSFRLIINQTLNGSGVLAGLLVVLWKQRGIKELLRS